MIFEWMVLLVIFCSKFSDLPQFLMRSNINQVIQGALRRLMMNYLV